MEKNIKEKAIPQEHRAVYEVIANHSDKYITRKLIISKLGRTSDYGRRLSEIIYELVVKYGVPIGSSSTEGKKGYFIIENTNDLRVAKRDLSSRTFSMNQRIDALEKIKI